MSRDEGICPFVGLQPYTEKDRDYFFGREGEVRIISSNLYAAPLTVLYGASGVGKSSVLLAGVVPNLQAAAHTAVVVFNKWQVSEPDHLLKAKCLEAVERAQKKPLHLDLSLPLDDLLLAAAAEFSGTILIILDQFEEYFLYTPESQAENSFDAQLARAINREDVDANFLIALRDDGLAKLDRFRARIPHLLGNTLRLRHLDPAAARTAIVKPLEVFSRRFPQTSAPTQVEDELVEKILCQVQRGQVALSRSVGMGQAPSTARDAQIETPFLQLVLTRLWEEETKEKSQLLRASTLERLGGAQKIARTYLADIMARLGPRQCEICARFFDRLVTPSGSKIAYTVEDLTKFAGDLAAEVPSVLGILSEARLLRTVVPTPDQSSCARYEIFHDVLAPAILDWRRQFISEQERLEAQRQAEARLEAARTKLKIRRLVASTSVAIVIAALAIALAFSVSVQRRHQQQLTDQQRQRAVMAEESVKEAATAVAEERTARAKAEAAVAEAEKQNKQAQDASKAYVEKLQTQLAAASKVIEQSVQNATEAEEKAKAYLAKAEQSAKELEVAKAQASRLAAEARAADERAGLAQNAAERARGSANAAQKGASRDVQELNQMNAKPSSPRK